MTFCVGATAQSDTTNPAIALDSDANGTTLSRLPSPLTGTVFDAGGMGNLLTVRFYRNRSGSYERWTGSAWVDIAAGDSHWEATVTPTGTDNTYHWSADVPWPTGGNLPRGAYTIGITAADNASNRSTIHRNVTIGEPDTTAPALTIVSPAHGEVVENGPGHFESISGTVNDGSGSGVAYIELYLARTWYEGAQWWNGGEWGGYHKFRPTMGAPAADGTRTWSLSGLPAGEQLTTGFYYIDVLAYDYNGNSSFARHVVYVAPVDTVAPTLDVTFPAEGQQLYNLPEIRGTSADEGSGVSRVEVVLMRRVQQEDGSPLYYYWDGNQWGASAVPLPSRLDTSWRRNQNLPAGAALVPGDYIVMCHAIDRYNNVKAFYRNFSIVPVPALTIDAHLRADDSQSWLGEGFSNSDAQGQTLTGAILSGQTQTRQVRIVRSGGLESKSVRVTIPDWAAFAAAGWTARFSDATSGGSDISSQITGTNGWSTVMSDGEAKSLRVEVTAPSGAAKGAKGALTFRVEADPTSESSALDVVKAVWTTVAPTPDLSVRADKGEGAWRGEGVFNETGAQQTLERVIKAGQAVRGAIKLSVSDAVEGQSVRWSAPDFDQFATGGWQVRFFDQPVNGNDITAALSAGMWTTRHTPGTAPTIGIEVTAPADATSATRDLRVRAQIEGASGAADAVKLKFEVLPDAQPDVAISRLDSNSYPTNYVGLNKFSPDAQQIEMVSSRSEVNKFAVQIKNTGTKASAFAFEVPRLTLGWGVTFFDALQNGSPLDVSQGTVVTAPIEPNQSVTWRMEVSPLAAQKGSLSVPLSFSGGNLTDQCEVSVIIQEILGIKWLNGEKGWQWSDDLTPLLIEQNATVGLMAVKSVPDAPWPDKNTLGPLWRWGLVEAIGEIIWVQGKDISVTSGIEVSAQLGAQKELVTVRARPELSVALSATKTNLLVGDGPQDLRSTSVIVAVDTDVAGLQDEVKVRLQTVNEHGQNAGRWNETDAPYLDVSVKVKSATTVTWSSGGEAGQIEFKATILDEKGRPRKIEDATYIQIHKPYAQIKFSNWREENGVWSRTVTASTWFLGEKLGGIALSLNSRIKDYESEQTVAGWANAAPFDNATGTTNANGEFSTVQRWNPVEADAWPHDFIVEAEAQLQ